MPNQRVSDRFSRWLPHACPERTNSSLASGKSGNRRDADGDSNSDDDNNDDIDNDVNGNDNVDDIDNDRGKNDHIENDNSNINFILPTTVSLTD